MTKNRHPFEASFSEIQEDIDAFVATVFESLQSSFLLLPQGACFVPYTRFEQAYEVLKRHTDAFTVIKPDRVLDALGEDGLTLVVLRAILGLTPPEWASVASAESGEMISQSFARGLDRKVRADEQSISSLSPTSGRRLQLLVGSACQLLAKGADLASPGMIHRLDKADTSSGISGIQHVAAEGLPYAMVLYERFLGRPFAGHRDSVSELVGEEMESAVEKQLRRAGIGFRKTRRAETVPGFEQAPDFIIPDEWNPRIIIEAKIAEDDGTARDKVARIQNLATYRNKRLEQGLAGYEIVACIDGRGFGVRRTDMKKMLEATQGKVFTFKTLDRLVDNTALRQFRSRL